MKSIGDYSFLDCSCLSGVLEVYIPPNVTAIAGGSFNEGEKVSIYGVSGSYAQSFANANGNQFKDISKWTYD